MFPHQSANVLSVVRSNIERLRERTVSSTAAEAVA
jgi:hypothetical protein